MVKYILQCRALASKWWEKTDEMMLMFFDSIFRLKQLIGHLREDATAIDPDTLISNLEYVADVVSWMASKTE